MEADVIHVKKIKKYFIDLLEKNFDDIKYNGESNNMDSSLFKILSVSFPKNPISEMLLFQLDIMGISCSGGSACSSGATSGSHVLKALGYHDPTKASLRFSFSRYTTFEDIDMALEAISRVFAPIESSATVG